MYLDYFIIEPSRIKLLSHPSTNQSDICVAITAGADTTITGAAADYVTARASCTFYRTQCWVDNLFFIVLSRIYWHDWFNINKINYNKSLILFFCFPCSFTLTMVYVYDFNIIMIQTFNLDRVTRLTVFTISLSHKISFIWERAGGGGGGAE